MRASGSKHVEHRLKATTEHSKGGARRRTHQTAIVVSIELVEHFAGPLQENAVVLCVFIREEV